MWRIASAAVRLPQHRELAFIDAHRAVFAGVIDADHRRDLVVAALAGRGGTGFAAHLRLRSSSTSAEQRRAQRDQRIIARERNAEEPPSRQVAAHLARRVQIARPWKSMRVAGAGRAAPATIAIRRPPDTTPIAPDVATSRITSERDARSVASSRLTKTPPQKPRTAAAMMRPALPMAHLARRHSRRYTGSRARRG